MSWTVPQHFSMIQKAGQEAERYCPHLPACPSSGVYWADTYKILGDCGGSEAFTPQGMLHPGPVLCPPVPLQFVILKQKQNGQGITFVSFHSLGIFHRNISDAI